MLNRVQWTGRRIAVVGAALMAAAAGVAIAAAVLALSGGSSQSGLPADADSWDVIRVDADLAYLPTLANADLAVGPTRLSFVVQDADAIIVSDVDVVASLYDLERDREHAVSTQPAAFIPYGAESPVPTPHRHADGSPSDDARSVGAGVYVVPVTFTHAGVWGLEFRITPRGGGADASTVRFRLSVRERPQAPAVGDPAPRSRTRTLADEPDIRRLTSDLAPEPGLYQLSVDEALDQGGPLIVAFATPAFCHSRTCGPTMDIVKQVWRAHAPAVRAIHVEVFENPDEPDALREAAAFLEWGLPSEPWVFVVDTAGRISARFEGTLTVQELEAAVRAALQP